MISKSGLLIRVTRACSSRPKIVIAVWVLALVLMLIASQYSASSLESNNILLGGTRSADAIELENARFGETQSLAVLIEGNPKSIERFGPRVAKRLNRIPQVGVLSPWSPNAPDLLRPKRSQALLVLQVRRTYDATGKETVPAVQKQLREVLPEAMGSYVTGNSALATEISRAAQKAATQSQKFAAPILLVILLLVFRTPVAALIPAVLGFTVVASGGGVLALLSRVLDIDAMATILMSMMGLALGVDYSLLIVSRFRDETGKGHSHSEALEQTVLTAGRTVLFAGAVLMSAMLAALLVSPGDMLLSVTVGVVGGTLLAVVGSATLLPALLSILAPYLERWRIGRKSPKMRVGKVIKRLIRKPVVATAAILIPLLAMSAPALGIELGGPSASALPEGNPVREDFEKISQEVGSGWSSVFTVIAVSEDGPITKKKKLATLDKFQKKLTHKDGIDTVLGPAALNEQSKKLQKVAGNLSKQRKNLNKLEGGLGDAKGGVGDLRKGLNQASSGAKSLEQGLGKSLDGTLELSSALDETTSGSHKLEGSIAEALDGAKKIASAADEVEKGSAQVKDATKDFADELAGGKEGLESLRQASADATNELTLAVAALDSTTAATKSDPEFAVAYERAATALATLNGQNPQSGQQVESGYYGMESSIARATEQNITASKEASNLASGAGELHGGLVELGKGTDSLLHGLDEIHTGSGALASGLERTREGTGGLSSGNQTLVGGANSLKEGAGRLAGKLGEGHTRSAVLESGLEQMAGSVGQYNSSQGSAGTVEQQKNTTKSGYFLLAGIDGGDVDEQESAAFAINWDKGGSAGRIMVVPNSANSKRGVDAAGPEGMRRLNRLNARLNGMAPKLADNLSAKTAVGGRGAVLTDFVERGKSQLFPLILTLVLVALILLTIIFRSPLLALKAVILNLLTVAAAFGVLALVYTGGSPILGGPGYLNPIIVYGILAIVFALSIDYEVFMVTRMREGYLRTGTTDGAIEYGIDHTARVITGAAAIMIGVFVAFGISDFTNARALGAGLGVAVFLDATVVRLVLLPAAMKLFGRANWWMPKWLDRLLPKIGVEGEVR